MSPTTPADIHDLHQLVNELFLSIRLDQHRRASQLSGKISRLLITTLDDELDHIQDYAHEDHNDQDNELDSLVRQTLDLVEIICDRLNRFSRMIDIYQEVVEFVQVQASSITSKANRSEYLSRPLLSTDQLIITSTPRCLVGSGLFE